jgi:pimeloyl-ACP methyl ester carboxylesterase
VKKRTGIVGGVVGGAAAAAAAAAFVVERRAVARRRARGTESSPFETLPSDRHGTVVCEDGAGLYYEEVGPLDALLTLVFVHGYTLNLRAFHFQRQALQAHYGDRVRLIFFDQRSHGRSERSDPKRSSIDQLGRDLYSVIETLAPHGQVMLVGHSMGGMTILALADGHPELFETPPGRRAVPRVAAAVLISTSAGNMASVTLGLPAMLAKIKGPLLPLLLRGARRQADLVERGRAIGTDLAWVFTRKLSFGSTGVAPATVEYLTTMIASTRIEVIADFYPALISHDKLSALGVLADTRVLIICGDRDVLTPLSHSKAMAEELPKAELVVVPQAGHVVVMEFPEVVDEALQRLVDTVLDELGRRRRWRRA